MVFSSLNSAALRRAAAVLDRTDRGRRFDGFVRQTGEVACASASSAQAQSSAEAFVVVAWDKPRGAGTRLS
jgi:hypothetical protein